MLELAKEASIEEKIRIRKKEKSKKRGTANRRMEPGQPKKKRMKLDKEDEDEDNEERQEAREGRTTYKHTEMAPSSPPRKRKVGEDRERRRTPKKARGNQDIKKYIT
jgi:hypothetical protein